MNSNEKRLLTLLLLAIVFWGGVTYFSGGGDEGKQLSLTQLQDEVELKERQLAHDKELQQETSARLQNTLTNDIPQATTLGQSWLLALGEHCKIRTVSVTPFPPQETEQNVTILPFSVTGESDRDGAVLFLRHLRNASVEHRVRRFSLIFDGANNAHLSLDLDILCSSDGGRDAILVESLPMADSAWAALKENLWLKPRQATATPKAITQRPNVSPPPTVLAHWKLVGIIADASKPEAWFIDTDTDKEYLRTVGDLLNLDSLQSTISRIDEQGVVLAAGDEQQTVRVGDTLTLLERP